MNIKKAGLNKKRIYASLIVLACLIFFDFLGIFESVNNYLYDIFFRIRGQTGCAKDILLINIDDKTLERLGRWPIKRSYYAFLIDKLSDSRAVVFDILMTEPTIEDSILSDAIKRHGKVFLPVLIEEGKKITYPSVYYFPEYTGHIHIEQDVDGIARSVYHTIIVDKKPVPSITSSVYEYITRKTFKREVRQGITATGKDKILQYDRMRINYAGGYGSFESISFIDIIDDIFPPAFFKNRIIIVGLTATGTSDVILTPFLKDRRGMTGLEVQANILNTLIFENAIFDIHQLLRWLFFSIIAITAFIVFMSIDEKKAAIFGLLLILFITLLSYFLFTRINVWSAPAIYPAGIFFVFVLAYIYKFEDAVKMLQNTYVTLESRLRWKIGEKEDIHTKKGILSILTKKGLHLQVNVLNEVGRQLNFEKELSDRALMSNIHGVMLFDRDGNNILINNYALSIFKTISIETSSIDGFIVNLIPFLLEKTDHEAIKKAIFNENSQVSFTLAIAEKEKRFYKIDFSKFDVDGAIYLLAIITDITKIKELELLKSHIISVVSHELKSPMTSIQGFSEILLKNLTGKMQNFAAIINRESERLVRFLNTFLDITRIEEGRQPVKISPVNLANVAEEVAHALKPIGDVNKIAIHTELPESIEDIMIDRDLTKQCIFNLVENAIKYSPPEKDVIIRLSDEKDAIRIDIIDHGYGIKEEDLGRIFDKFYRSTSEKTKNIKGSGLGLTFVKEAVELQGGKLTLTSKYNEGSTFSIIFPKKVNKS